MSLDLAALRRQAEACGDPMALHPSVVLELLSVLADRQGKLDSVLRWSDEVMDALGLPRDAAPIEAMRLRAKLEAAETPHEAVAVHGYKLALDLRDARVEIAALKARLAAWETAPRIGIIIRTEGHADVSWYDTLPPLNEVRAFAAIPSVPMSR